MSSPLSNWAIAAGWAGLGMFGVVNGASASSAAVLGAACVCTMLRGRWVVSLPLSLGTAAALLATAGLLGEGLFEGSDFPSSYVSRAALGLAAVQCLSFLRSYEGREELAACFVSVSLGIVSTVTYTAEPLPLGILVGFQLVFLAMALRLTTSRVTVSRGSLLALLLSLSLTAAMAASLRAGDGSVRRWMGNLLVSSSDSFSFPGVSHLDTMQSGQKNPTVVLRYHSSKPPRYLVGSVYVTYEDKIWKTVAKQNPVEPGFSAEEDSVYSLYQGPAPTADLTDDVEMAGIGQALFLPRDCYQFSLIRSASLSRAHLHIHGTGRRQGDTFEADVHGDYSGRYRVERSDRFFVPRWEEKETAQERQAYLQLPTKLSPLIVQLALECSRSGTSEAQKAKLLESFLQDNYTYGFGYPFSDSVDPIADFLEKKPAAHCELFATSLTLMLRSLHIPARYINGFVVREPTVDGDYWVVRARDAHAWVEAFVEGHWITLDATPPAAGLENPGSDWLESLTEWLAVRWSRLLRLDFYSFWDWLKESAKSVAAPSVALGLGYLAWRRRGRWSWRRGSREARPDRRPTEELPLLLEAFQRAGAPMGWSRPPHLTLATWSAQLPDHPLRPVARDFLETYTQLRYGQPKVTAPEIARLRDLLQEFRSSSQPDHKPPG